MEECGGGDLLSEAMGSGARVVLVEDCVEAPAAFVLHLLLKRAFAGAGAAVFLALSQPFSHYDRILRKMGCNLSLHRRSERLHFFELQAFPGKQSLFYLVLFGLEKLSCNYYLVRCHFICFFAAGGAKEASITDSFVRLYSQIQRVVETNWTGENAGKFIIMIDDISLLEVAAHGSVNDVLDFLHYCVTLTSEMNCSLVILIHEDIYSSEENMGLLVHLRYIADLVIKAAPLSTGLAADVHGQLSVVNKCVFSEQRSKVQKVWNFHFKMKENGAEFFYPGSRR
ncbi:hypothetical protein PR202_ga26120 [Eleusine coracana subsp. coracana]|uniref:Elongator complex protein 6 n=1 Tax=Eleusine coracana subsp. coracana TaxID=191504 RepID=A0AAV5DD84_ELECO|nr:hypothetical protein PR202_ga26120 [Eleusine coracana subsp. coracana]